MTLFTSLYASGTTSLKGACVGFSSSSFHNCIIRTQNYQKGNKNGSQITAPNEEVLLTKNSR